MSLGARRGYDESMRTRWWLTGVVALAFAASLSGCTVSTAIDPGPSEVAEMSPSETPSAEPAPPQARGDTATWELLDESDVSTKSTSLEVGATRLECASGVTGELLDPVIVYESDQVVITIDAALNGTGGADCQGNDVVPVTVELSEPLGARKLIDGACVPVEMHEMAPCLTSERASALSS